MPVVTGSPFLSEHHDAITGMPSLVAMFGFDAIGTGTSSDSITFRPNFRQDVAWLRLSYGIGTPYKGTGSLIIKGFEPSIDKVYVSSYDISGGLYAAYFDVDRDGFRDTVVGKTSAFRGKGSVSDPVVIFSNVSPVSLGLSYDYATRNYKVPLSGSAFINDLLYRPESILAGSTAGLAWI